jgi:hypothetical protein
MFAVNVLKVDEIIRDFSFVYPFIACAYRQSNLVSILKRLFCPNSSLFSKFNPRNIKYMPVVKFIERLNVE